MRYSTYTLRIETTLLTLPGDESPLLDSVEFAELQRALSHAEDVINDRLPEGFYCKIDQHGGGQGVDMGAVEDLERIARDGT